VTLKGGFSRPAGRERARIWEAFLPANDPQAMLLYLLIMDGLRPEKPEESAPAN
jgi:hypothetical protein